MSLRKLLPVLLLSALALRAQGPPEPPFDQVWAQILMKNWDQATRELDRAEKGGRCKEAVCLAWRARIAEGTGDAAQALALARRAADLFGPDSGLKAGDYNEVGAILYRRGEHDPKALKLVETAFRQADSLYHGEASNIRFNLATVLKAQGRTKEAKTIMAALEAEGMLIDPGMAILGDFQRPGLE
jgi:Flp pilus assembly protein TadD